MGGRVHSFGRSLFVDGCGIAGRAPEAPAEHTDTLRVPPGRETVGPRRSLHELGRALAPGEGHAWKPRLSRSIPLWAGRWWGYRATRYVGRAKTHLQHLLTAAAINLIRLADWFETPGHTRRTPTAFTALMAPAS
jgi:hypothetical protein